MTKRPSKVRKITAEDTTEGAMLKLVAWYLESKGWTVAVIGASRIQGPVDAPCNFELVFRFTGAKRKRR